MARKSRQVESRLIAEYLKERYAKFPHWTNQPLGVVPEHLMREVGYERALAMSYSSRYKVDGVAILPRYIVIIEAKVFQVLAGLGKLPLYKSLVPVTPEFREYMPRGVIMELVVGWTNPNLEIMARDAGVVLRLFYKPWLEEVVQQQQQYFTRDYRYQREQKLKMREFYGIE